MISILLATYNGERYIKESIDSIINQTFTEWELLIGFNGTTDNSKDIVNGYNDDRIRVFDYGDDKGKPQTLNKLLSEAKYEWCAIQDDDDVWEVNKFEEQIKYTNQFDIIGTFITYIDENGLKTGSPNLSNDHEMIIRRSLNGDNQIANSSAIFKRIDALEIGGWDTKLSGIEDFDFWLKLIRNNKKTINIPKSLVNHRLHNNSNFNTQTYDLNKIL